MEGGTTIRNSSVSILHFFHLSSTLLCWCPHYLEMSQSLSKRSYAKSYVAFGTFVGI